MSSEYTKHYSVLLHECIDYLTQSYESQKESYIFADMTFGGGGHTSALATTTKVAHVYSVDQDPEALENGKKLILKKDLESKVTLINSNFEHFNRWIIEHKTDLKLDGILADLGVSSHHFDSFARGFSFREDAPLDMRMNHHDNSIPTAASLLNSLDEEEIANLIYKYGEEGFSRIIAKNICEFRKNKNIETTKELESIVFHSYPSKMRKSKTHPATKTFQALRIAVNRELEVIENSIENWFDLLDDYGVLAVISFHSLEDRIIKHKFKEISQSDNFTARILTKKPITASDEELNENPRSRSAKLRCIQKIPKQDVKDGYKKNKKFKKEKYI